ncbi:MAG: hypothetical protein INR62_08330 [Rhodospirillales bacterium]|nr:hypothetical protein [Acetobacter sp.]
MRIQVVFHFKSESAPAAVTGVEDHVTDLLLPSPGDTVTHQGMDGKPFTGRVAERNFCYDLLPGPDTSGEVTVTLLLERVLLQ